MPWSSGVVSDRLDVDIVPLDSAATAHMIDRVSNLGRYVTGETRCDMMMTSSCCRTRAERKGPLDFAIEDIKGKQCRVYVEVLVVLKLGANLYSVGALGEHGVRYDNGRSSPGGKRGEGQRLSSEPPYQSDVRPRNHADRRRACPITAEQEGIWYRRLNHWDSKRCSYIRA